MCLFSRKLCATNNGEVRLSDCGNSLQFMYNNIIVIYNYSAFHNFYKNVYDCYSNVRYDKNQTRRDVSFATKIDNLFLQFSVEEIIELHYLLQSAIIEYETAVHV